MATPPSMKIALVTRHANPRFTPLALLYLKARLVACHGLGMDDVSVLEFGPDAGAEDIACAVAALTPDVVGFSCYVWNVETLLEAAARIRHALPLAALVLGGPEVGPVSRAVLEAHPAVDVVVQSEGEIPFGEIVERCRAHRDLGDVNGITWRRDGAIVENPHAAILRDLDALPSPHQLGYGDLADRFVCIETQRGCVFRCAFCYYNKDFSIRNRRFGLERVKREILHGLRSGARRIYLMDPIFNLDARRAKEICRFIIAHNTTDVEFHTEIWAEFVDAELAGLLREARFTFLEVGLQSADPDVLDAAGRPWKADRFAKGFGHLRAAGLATELHLILGLPGQTLDSFKASLDAAAALAPGRIAVYDLLVLPGTETWTKAGALGLVFDPRPPYRIRRTPDLSEADLRTGRRLAGRVDVLRKSVALRLLCAHRGIRWSALGEAAARWEEGAFDGDPAPPGTAAWGERMQGFVRAVCLKHGVDPGFFGQAFAVECVGLPLPPEVECTAPRAGGGTGIRRGLKIPGPQGRVGSTPTPPTLNGRP